MSTKYPYRVYVVAPDKTEVLVGIYSDRAAAVTKRTKLLRTGRDAFLGFQFNDSEDGDGQPE